MHQHNLSFDRVFRANRVGVEPVVQMPVVKIHPFKSLASLVLVATFFATAACGKQELAQPPDADHGERPEQPLQARAYDLGKAHAAVYEFDQSGALEDSLEEGEVRNVPIYLRAGRCFVVTASAGTGESGDGDGLSLALSVISPDNAPLVHHAPGGPDAFVGQPHSVCPETPGQYRIRFRMTRGTGQVAYRLYGRDVI